MFLFFSKLLYFLIQPVNWMVLPLVYAVLGKNQKWKRRCLLTSCLVGLFFTNHFIFNQCIKLWEVNTQTVDEIQETYDIGILLGGYSNFFIEPNTDRLNFNSRGGRITHAVELYRKGKFKKFLLTGGSGLVIFKTNQSEAIHAREYLMRMGIPDQDIIVEPDSRNTHENATLTKKILDEKYPNAKCLLITSAWHMRRSMGCFDKEGIEYTPFSVDHIGEMNRFVPASLIIPNSETIYRWELLIKEMVGSVAYKLRGYT